MCPLSEMGSVPTPLGGSARIWTAVSPPQRTITGAPGEAQRSGFAGERRSSGMSEFSPLWGGNEGYGACDDDKPDKSRGRRWLPRPVTSSRSAGRYRVLRCIKSGVKIPAVLSLLRSRSQKGYSRKKKTGATHGSGPALLAEKRKQPNLPKGPPTSAALLSGQATG